MVTIITISVGGLCKVITLTALFSLGVGIFLGAIWTKRGK